jgi:ubiquinone/menaquinone biosynthesis C-methylase UbiE
MDERNAIRRAYDDLAETYATGRSETGRDMDILAEFLGTLPAESRILDVGCGQGIPVLREVIATTTTTTTTYGHGLGLDFSREQLQLAAENLSDAPLLQADITQLPFDDGVVDAIVAYHTLIHLPLDDQETAIAHFSRVLRSGGQLLLSEGPTEWSGTNPNWLDTGVEMRWHIAGGKQTRTQLQDAGFTITDEWVVDEDEHWMFLAAELES